MKLAVTIPAQNEEKTIGQVIARSDAVMREVRPDALLVLGDTNSCLSAISAKRLRIPVFHMEAGNRCFDERVPEEINRRIVDHISDINLPYSSLSREYLLREGIAPDRVIKMGTPMREVLDHYMPKIERSAALKTLKLKPQDYFLVSAHREETVDDAGQLKRLVDVLNADDFFQEDDIGFLFDDLVDFAGLFAVLNIPLENANRGARG